MALLVGFLVCAVFLYTVYWWDENSGRRETRFRQRVYRAIDDRDRHRELMARLEESEHAATALPGDED